METSACLLHYYGTTFASTGQSVMKHGDSAYERMHQDVCSSNKEDRRQPGSRHMQDGGALTLRHGDDTSCRLSQRDHEPAHEGKKGATSNTTFTLARLWQDVRRGCSLPAPACILQEKTRPGVLIEKNHGGEVLLCTLEEKITKSRRAEWILHSSERQMHRSNQLLFK